MKKMFVLFTVVAAIATFTTISSCKKTCGVGYEGSDCKTAMNTKFAGSYNVSDTAQNGSAQQIFNYIMTVSASSSDPSTVTIGNFGGFNTGSVTTGTVDGTTLSIPNTTIGLVSISNASGTISNNTLTFSYTAVDSTGTAVDHAVGTK